MTAWPKPDPSAFPASGITLGGDVNLYRNSTNVLRTDDSVMVERQAANQQALVLRNFGEVFHRLIALADGSILLGSGAALGDTNLYRGNVDQLRTDDTFLAPNLPARVVHGIVTGTTGAVQQGTGFTAVRNGVGNYTVTFTTAFGVAPRVMLSVIGAGPVLARVASITTGGFVVDVFDTSTTANADRDFSLEAIA